MQRKPVQLRLDNLSQLSTSVGDVRSGVCRLRHPITPRLVIGQHHEKEKNITKKRDTWIL